jgi:hypothetical protein
VSLLLMSTPAGLEGFVAKLCIPPPLSEQAIRDKSSQKSSRPRPVPCLGFFSSVRFSHFAVIPEKIDVNPDYP